MANIDELHWSAILDTKDFDAKAKKLRDDALALNKDLSEMLGIYEKFKGKSIITDKGVSNAKEMSAILGEIANKMSQLPNAVKVFDEKSGSTKKKVAETNEQFRAQSGLLRQLTSLAGTYFSVRGVQQFLKSLIDITGQFEAQKVALTSMLQSNDMADSIFGQFRQLALESPYTFQEFTKFGKQLIAFNIPAQDLVDTTKMLADVAAGLDVDMGRIILAYGQIKSAGVLKGTELRQLTEAGVPILDSLAKQIEETTGKTVRLADVFAMISKKQIPFEMVEKAFRDMTSEGGKFYNMQEVLVETLKGKIGKLRDVWQQALYDLGDANSGPLKSAVDMVIKLVGHLEEIVKIFTPLVAALGVYGATLLVAKGAQEAVFGARAIRDIIKFVKGVEGAAKGMEAFAIASKGASLALGAITLITVAVIELTKNANKLNKELDKIVQDRSLEANSMVDGLNKVVDKLKNAKKGSQDYRDAIHELNTKYGEYLPNLVNEKNALDQVTASANAAAEAIRNKARASAEEQGIKAIEDDYGRKRDKRTNSVVEGMYNLLGGTGPFEFKNESQSRKDIVNFMSSFRKDIERAIDAGDAEKFGQELGTRFSSSFVKYFGEELDPKIYNALSADVTAFFNVVKDIADERVALSNTLDVNFGDRYTSKKHRQMSEKIQEDFEKDMADIKAKVLTEKQYAEEVRKAEEKRDKAIEEMYKDLGIPAPPKQLKGIDTTVTAKVSTTKQENVIKKRISNLQKYKDTYDKLRLTVGEEKAVNLMGYFYGEGEKDLNYIERINDELEELLRLNPALQEYADGVRQSFGKDMVDEYLKADKALDDVNKKIDEYLGKDFGAAGEKVAAKINTEIRSLFNKNQGVDFKINEWINELNEGRQKIIDDWRAQNENLIKEISPSYAEFLADAYWKEYRARRVKELTDQAKQEKDANTVAAKERIRALVKNIFSEQMEGFDLTNWNDKTLGQINEIKEAISKVEVPDEIKEDLMSVEGLLDLVLKELENYKNSVTENTVNPEEWKKQLSSAKKFTSELTKAASKMKELADAAGNVDLSGAMEMVGNLGDTISAMISGAQSGGLEGALVAGAMTFIEKLMGYVLKAENETMALTEAVNNARREMEGALFKKRLSDGVDGIFGEDTIKSIGLASDAIKDLTDQYDDLLGMFDKVRNAEIGAYVRASSGGGGQSASLAAAREKLLQRINGIEDLVFYSGKGVMSIKEAADVLGMKLRDDFGHINPELIDKIIEVYNLEDSVKKYRGDRETLDYLKALSQYAKDYAAAMEQIGDVVKDVFGGIADNMVDSFLDNFKEVGNAVDDLGDTFTSLGETIVKSMLKSYVLDNILKKYEDEAKQMMMDYSTGGITYDQLAERVGAFADAVTADTEAAGEYINAMLSAFQERGLLGEEGQSEGLSGGIKGITEDTAGLLASYINAIRADVSYMRMMSESGWADVSSINTVLPTLNDYLAQVAASNYDIAQSNRQLLTEIQSVITSSSGRRAIAVDVQ